MAKTRLTLGKRDIISNHFVCEYRRKEKKARQKTLKQAIAAAGQAVRKKYPESDMAVLRKYNSTQFDYCLRFMDLDTQRFFGVDFPFSRYDSESKAEAHDLGFPDLPKERGCTSRDVFHTTAKQTQVLEAFQRDMETQKQAFEAFTNNLRSVLLSAKTVEDVHAVLPLPNELLAKLSEGNSALVVLNEDAAKAVKAALAA